MLYQLSYEASLSCSEASGGFTTAKITFTSSNCNGGDNYFTYLEARGVEESHVVPVWVHLQDSDITSVTVKINHITFTT